MTAAPDGFAPERWTYGGVYPGTKTPRLAVWYDEARRRLTYPPIPRTSPVVGGVYEVFARRADGQVTRAGAVPAYRGRHDDAAWVAQIEAGAYAAQRRIAAAALERREARDGGELGKLIGPLADAAERMTHAQRGALIEMVTDRIYAARPGRRRGLCSYSRSR